ncbi:MULTISPECIES: Rv0361 family membrane protein [Gordonia]|jgi:hypothetical protein|uniref:Rv0361 family membrane protein n=1 Tax=Gordonia TaxID=2053 RepID=UPI0004B4F9B3|nr:MULTISPECIES: hypothetical protein [Gordonia]MDH3008356.1 hypothetical protein [Gordonia alkanivorans]MDH3012403.1 hypothetical protein [Gordonia alkanivorans]MDH3017254.1 hypothetical protein [Gordonia alkanivorans]MDH3021801.1 hypothetical protein [Gordonia alkanivorans]MDH3025136.1 hypothetical protein [Gordonia alkanivorans]
MAKAAGGGPDKPSGKGAASGNTSRGAASSKKSALGKATSNDDVDAALVEEGPPNWKNAWPFFVAAGVVALLVLGIVLSSISRPPEERVSDDARVQYAINDLYTAKNGPNYAEYRANTCDADLDKTGFPSEAQFVAENQASLDQNGRIEIPEITDLVVDGDRATAKVHWHYKDKADAKQVVETIVVRENGEWKVCSS